MSMVFFSFFFLCLFGFILTCSVATSEVVEQICRASVQGCIKPWHCLCMTFFFFFFTFVVFFRVKKKFQWVRSLFRIQDNQICCWRIVFQSILLPIQAFLSISHVHVVSRTAFLMFSHMPPDSLFKTMWNIVAMSFAKWENRTACLNAVDVPNKNVGPHI